MWMQKHRAEEATGLDKRDPRLLRVLDLVEIYHQSGL